MIPITIFTGFLGSGKTTLINKIIEQNKDIRFGLIINEFGEVGIDGQIVTNSGEELIEMSNGCLCCIVRKDLQDAVLKLANTGKVDYILIEASGLAESLPIAQTFIMEDMGGKVSLDCVVATLDAAHYMVTKDTYKVAVEQIEFADIILFNKLEDAKQTDIDTLTKLVFKINPDATILYNNADFTTSLLIETNKWNADKLIDDKDEHSDHDHNYEHEHHHHEHSDVDEIVFTTHKVMDPTKLDTWMQENFPKNVVRAKGFLRLPIPVDDQPISTFLFQMVGSRKQLNPFKPTNLNFDYDRSIMVFIGKDLDKENIVQSLEACTI